MTCRLTRRLLLLICLSLAAIAHAQPAGRVLVAAGEVSALRGGRDLVLTRGAEVFSGDTIRTGELSNAQIAFSDSAIVALRSNSIFRIDDYRFDRNSETTSNALFSLVRGGLRTITGLIGKSQKNNYRVNAAIATLGIRGTHYNLVLCQQDCRDSDGSLAADGVYGGVLEGRIALGNKGGEHEFGADEYFFVADINTPPQRLLGRPGFLRDRLEARNRRDRGPQQPALARAEARDEKDDEARFSRAALAFGKPDLKAEAARLAAAGNDPRLATAFAGAIVVGQGGAVVVGDLRDSTGNIAVLGPGLGLSIGYAGASVRSSTDGGTGTAIVVGNGGTTLDKFRLLDGEISGSRNGAAIADVGHIAGDGNIYWGRWGPAGDVTVSGITFSPPTGVHFVFGALTPPDVLSRPTATIGVASSGYDYVGGTRPTDGGGQTGQFLSGLFNVDFLARTINGGVKYQVGNFTYNLPVPIGTPLQARPGVIGFLLTPRNGGSWSNSANNASGTLDTYAISGLFLGSRAQGLGVTFATLDQIAGRSAGAAVFKCRGCKP